MNSPAVVRIPLSQLLPNPAQPRRRFQPGSLQQMAESLKALGQETSLKVRALTAEEKATNPGFEYMVIGGHRRLGGAKLAGLEALDCIVLDIPPPKPIGPLLWTTTRRKWTGGIGTWPLRRRQMIPGWPKGP